MSTQNVSAYKAFDPYFVQRIETALSAAKGGQGFTPNSPLFNLNPTQTAYAPQVTEEDIAAYRQQIAEIERLQKESQRGMIVDQEGQKCQIQSDGYVATDGCNDGKISFGKKLKNFVKGVGRTFTGLFTDENGKFSLKKTLKSGLIAGACAIVSVLCPPAGAALLYAGLAMGTVGVIKNGIKAGKATTDQEAEQAWQGIGTNGTIAVMSLMGLKNKGAAANLESGITKESGIKGSLSGFASDLKAGFKVNNQEIMTAVNDIKAGTFIDGVGNNIATKIFNVKDWKALKALDAKDMRDAFCRNVKEQAYEKVAGRSKYLDNAEKSIKDKIAEIEKAQTEEGITPDKFSELAQQKAQLEKQLNVYNRNSNARINEKALAKREAKLEKLEGELSELKTQLRNATNTDAKKVLKSNIADKKLEISNAKAMISEYQNYDAYLNNRFLKMASKNFDYKHPSKWDRFWTINKPTLGLSSTPWVVQTEAISNALSAKPTLISISPDEAAAINMQYQHELAAQKEALSQQYLTLAQQAQAQAQTPAATPTVGITAPANPTGMSSQMLLQNWANQYRYV